MFICALAITDGLDSELLLALTLQPLLLILLPCFVVFFLFADISLLFYVCFPLLSKEFLGFGRERERETLACFLDFLSFFHNARVRL